MPLDVYKMNFLSKLTSPAVPESKIVFSKLFLKTNYRKTFFVCKTSKTHYYMCCSGGTCRMVHIDIK